MNIVVLCKSWNHKKVLEILEALRQQELRVRGIVALAKPSEKNTVSDLVRKMRARQATLLREWCGKFERRDFCQRFGVAGNQTFIKRPTARCTKSSTSHDDCGICRPASNRNGDGARFE